MSSSKSTSSTGVVKKKGGERMAETLALLTLIAGAGVGVYFWKPWEKKGTKTSDTTAAPTASDTTSAPTPVDTTSAPTPVDTTPAPTTPVVDTTAATPDVGGTDDETGNVGGTGTKAPSPRQFTGPELFGYSMLFTYGTALAILVPVIVLMYRLGYFKKLNLSKMVDSGRYGWVRALLLVLVFIGLFTAPMIYFGLGDPSSQKAIVDTFYYNSTALSGDASFYIPLVIFVSWIVLILLTLVVRDRQADEKLWGGQLRKRIKRMEQMEGKKFDRFVEEGKRSLKGMQTHEWEDLIFKYDGNLWKYDLDIFEKEIKVFDRNLGLVADSKHRQDLMKEVSKGTKTVAEAVTEYVEKVANSKLVEEAGANIFQAMDTTRKRLDEYIARGERIYQESRL